MNWLFVACLAVALADQNQLLRLQAEKCRHKNITIVAFPTVPRSGSSLFRLLFTAATGLRTQAVFRESNWPSIGIDNVFSGIKNFDLCSLIIKTHYPFMDSYVPPFVIQLRTVREPLSNFIAWMAHCNCETNFTSFAARWFEHHRFWDSISGEKHIILFEQLQASPANTMAKFFERVPLFRPNGSVDTSFVFQSQRIQLVGDCDRGSLESKSPPFAISVADYKIALSPDVVAMARHHNVPLFCLDHFDGRASNDA